MWVGFEKSYEKTHPKSVQYAARHPSHSFSDLAVIQMYNKNKGFF
jgi:hypothetical protein